ncbi:MAG TPA: biotin carboxylase N-terminal domain-containing protein [Candidatus Limnocylindrales bacterium]|nr:biotin carboxylase N-terminal domain-containing protein [Candidatus Limnocylindrales bacterium]
MSDGLSPSQVARRLDTSTRTVQRWIASGRLPARRVGSRWRVANDAIDAFIALETGAPAITTVPRPPAKLIRAVFIANRGEIAARISRTCRRLGIGSIVPDTDGPDALDLLDIDAVVGAAHAAGADAVHPGFGFLAENADFAEAVIASGIRWVGPPPDAIRAMGDKAAARRLAASLGVPVLAGYDEADQSDEALIAAGVRIGFPLLVKPAAGGGGKGMRTVRGAEALPDAIAGARREAAAAFGNDRLILERLVVGARHVEIQVLFDQHGTGISLGERDCSIQRRHQKILEESPSPAVDEALRRRLGEASLTLARAVGYVGAGTCEFLLDGRGRFTFLEMNTRLQVEHPVTELVTGRDLVADQLDIAAGQPLRVLDAPVPGGHAVEVRLYAEDAEDGFLPATGRVEALRWPSGDGVRVDAGIGLGTDIGGRFDPMLAKIIAWGPDRAAALERLAGALDRTLVLGVVTNLRFLRWLVRQPVVLAGEARTDVLTRIWPPDHWAGSTAIPDDAWSEAARALLATAETTDPWAGGWRLNAARSVRLETEGQHRLVAADPAPGGSEVDELVRVGDTVHLDLAGRSVAFRLAPAPDVDAAARASVAHGVSGTIGPVDVVAPMPGAVLAVHAAIGDAVVPGDPIVTLEAMKMEHAVVATIAGHLGELLVAPSDQVTRGQRLATIEP